MGMHIDSVKLKAYAYVLTSNEKFMHALFVYLAALASFAAMPFFPLVVVPFAALLPAWLAYAKKPEFGVLLLAWMNLLPAMYQSTVFGYIYLLALSIIMFKVWDNWLEIALLHIIIFLPFGVSVFYYLGGLVYLVMFISALYLGSFKSASLAVPSVLIVLLLSTMWQVPNSAYFPLRLDLYTFHESLLRPDVPSLAGFFNRAIPQALNNMFDVNNLMEFSSVAGMVVNNIVVNLLEDGGLIQAIFWTALLYFAAFYTGMVKGARGELEASLALLTVPLFYYGMYAMMGLPFPIGMAVYTLVDIGIFYLMNRQGVRFSREMEERHKRELKDFGIFGAEDLSVESNVRGLEDVADYEDVKKELIMAIKTPIEKPEIAYEYGLKPPKGILLFGPPGTGKTYLMRALAKELRYPFLYIRTSDLLSPYYGESEKNVSKIFDLARKKAPIILFFDEIDAIAKTRQSGGLDEITPRVLNTLLQELDGVVSKKPIIFVAATNVPELIDKALLRPGRIDKIIYMGLPDEKGRELIFRYYLKKLPTAKDIDYKKLAEMTERFSPADIANVVTEAKRKAAENALLKGTIEPVTMEDVVEVIKNTKPSTSESQLEDYEKFKMEFERRSIKVERKPEEEQVITFKDVADLEDVKKALKEAIELPMKHKELLKKFHIKPPNGVLLFGPPGTGKTYVAKAAAGEFGIPMIFLSGADLLKEGYVRAPEILKKAFNRAKDNSPAIIFIDEIETVAPAREGTSNPLMGQLLQEMDGVKSLKDVVVIGATNLPQLLDPALLRPGRFDKIIYVPPPDEDVRKAIFKIHLGKFASLFDLDYLAEKTDGFSGADITGICEELKLKLMNKAMEGKPVKLNQAEIDEILAGRRSSITPDLLEVYHRFMQEYGERK